MLSWRVLASDTTATSRVVLPGLVVSVFKKIGTHMATLPGAWLEGSVLGLVGLVLIYCLVNAIIIIIIIIIIVVVVVVVVVTG